MGRVIGVVNAIWARSGPRIFVHRIGHHTYLLKTPNVRTKEILLSRNVWMIAGHPMFVAPWSPDFSPEQPQLTSAVVPVELRGVPYLLYNNESLSRLATTIGKPISLAPETERKETFEVARLWVRVSLLNELPSRIVTGFSNGREVEISVSYPSLPSKCPTCGKFGHESVACSQSFVRGVTDTQVKSGNNPRPVRSRSRGSKRRSASRGGRSLHTRRQENLVYRVKEPKLPSCPAPSTEKESEVEEGVRDTGKCSDEVPITVNAAGGSSLESKVAVADHEGPPSQER